MPSQLSPQWLYGNSCTWDTGSTFTHCLDCIVKSPECSTCEQWAMYSANSERPTKGALHPIQESAQTAEISKG